MFIIRHALKNLGRNKGRSFLTGLLLVIILTCVTAALMIRDGAGKWAADYREKFGVEAGIETDWEYAGAHTEVKERVLEDGSVEGYSVFEAELFGNVGVGLCGRVGDKCFYTTKTFGVFNEANFFEN